METLASSCTEECFDDSGCGNALIAGTDTTNGEIHVYGNKCALKLLTDPEPAIRLHGLHELTEEQLAEIFTGGAYSANDPDWWRDGAAGWYGNSGMILHTLDPDDDSEYLAAVTTNETPEGELVAISANLLRDLLANPENFHAAGYIGYCGTHDLPRRWLEDLFSADEIRYPAAV